MRKSIQLLLVIVAFASFAFVNPPADLKQMVVVIDAGHGGDDFGAKHENHLEKDITEKIAAQIKALNRNANVVIHFTRTGDEAKGLIERTEFINDLKPDLVISLHVNSNEKSEASGIELYSSKESAHAFRSAQLAEKLKIKFEKVKFRVNTPQTAPLSILKNSNAPAVVVELGYLSNDRDRSYLTDEAYQKRIAATILEFLSEI